MNKITKELIILTTMLLVTQVTPQDCSCPSNPPSAPGNLLENLNFVAKNEIVDGVDYGVPIVLGGLIFLKADFEVTDSLEMLEAQCPTGYRPPTGVELQTIRASLGATAYVTLTNPLAMNFQPEYFYVSTEKSFPGLVDEENNDSWSFKGLYVDTFFRQITYTDVNTFWEPYKVTKCIMDKTLPIGGRTADMFVNQSYIIKALRSNLVSQVWQVDEEVKTTETVSLQYPNTGCHTIQAWGRNILNEVLYSCKNVFVVSPFGSDGVSTLNASTITARDLGIKARPNNSLFFSPSISPIAPKPNGGLYLSYLDLNDNSNCYIIEYDANMVQTKKTSLNMTIVPLDIVATSWGFVMLAREFTDSNNGFLIAFNADYTQKWKRVLQNNGPSPTTLNEQLTIYDPQGVPIKGNSLNFAINNGRLQNARGRISLIYSRYNHFGVLDSGVRNDHTGDGYLTFDENTGQDEKYSWIWSASHSLYQDHVYTGEFYATAALGDAYPQNIQVCIIDQSVTDGYMDGVRNKAIRHPKWCTNIAAGSIPGDGRGNTCGRLGGLHYMNGTFGLIYQRKPCKLLNQSLGKNVTQSVNELALLTFKFDSVTKKFSTVTKKVILSSTDLIMSVRSGKYGNKIFISYASQKTSNGSMTSNNNFYLGSETTKYMLIGFDGVIATSSLSAPVNSTPLSDEMKHLADGRLVWSFIDFSQNLFLYYTNPPPLVQNTSFVEIKEKTKDSKRKFLSPS